MTSTLRAFHNDPQIKANLLAQLREHSAADEIIQGQYWQNGKGCAVGCTVHSSDHALYESMYGIPRIIARLEDSIFERISNESAKTFPIEFIEAIPVGADLSMVWPKFAVWLLIDEAHGAARFDKSSSCKNVAALYKRRIAGEQISEKDRASSYAAAEAYAAADAAAAFAAFAAADAAADADAAAAAADAAAAQKEQLLKLLKAA